MKKLIGLFVLSILLCCLSTTFGQDRNIPEPVDTTTQTVFRSVEILPAFPGGEQAFAKFLTNHLLYPPLAWQQGIQGKVFAQFVVERNGSLTHIKILRDPGSGLGDEAVRVLKMSPHWKPGIQNGKPVRVLFVVPITFTIQIDTAALAKSIVKDGIYLLNVTQPPSFIGGIPALTDALNKNINYDKNVVNDTTPTRIYTEFIVEKDGALSNVNLLYNSDKTLGNEVAQALSKTIGWKPGISEHNNTQTTERVLYFLPIDLTSKGVNIPRMLTTQDSINAHLVFTQVDTLATFPGGEKAFAHFIVNTIHYYPETGKQKNITVQVFAQFIVEPDGYVSHIHIIDGPKPGLGLWEETARILLLSPNWIPAKKNGQAVRYSFTTPITYSLER